MTKTKTIQVVEVDDEFFDSVANRVASILEGKKTGPKKPYYSIAEAAKIAKLSPQTIQRHIYNHQKQEESRRQLKAIKPTGARDWIIYPSDLAEYLGIKEEQLINL